MKIPVWHFTHPGRAAAARGVYAAAHGSIWVAPTPLGALSHALGTGAIFGLTEIDDLASVTGAFATKSIEVEWGLDASDVLMRLSHHVARSVLHSWDAPSVVHRYLEGARELQSEARTAAKAVAEGDRTTLRGRIAAAAARATMLAASRMNAATACAAVVESAHKARILRVELAGISQRSQAFIQDRVAHGLTIDFNRRFDAYAETLRKELHDHDSPAAAQSE